ncbi:thiol-activated cytolysin family protein [Pedobacter panaciterrae]
MIRYFILLLLLSSTFIACKKAEKTESLVPPTVTPPVTEEPKVSAKAFKIDSIRSAVNKNAWYAVVSDSVWADSAGISFKVQTAEDFRDGALSFLGLVNNNIFPGALLQGDSMENLLYKPFVFTVYKQNPLVIYSTSPSFDPFMTTLIPSLAGSNDFIKNSLKANGKQVDGFTYSNGTEFRNYSEISITTGKNWDFSQLVIKKANDKGNIKKKTGFFVNYELSLFNIAVDFPASEHRIFEAGVDPALISGNPVYVSNVTYGRSAIIAIESDASFQQIKASFQNVQNGQGSVEDKNLFTEAVVTVYMRGFKAVDVSNIEAARGYDQVQLFVKSLAAGGSYSNADYGVPINFYVSKITDNSDLKFKFNYRLDFDVH